MVSHLIDDIYEIKQNDPNRAIPSVLLGFLYRNQTKRPIPESLTKRLIPETKRSIPGQNVSFPAKRSISVSQNGAFPTKK